VIDWGRLRTDDAYRYDVFVALFDKYQPEIAEYCARRLGEVLAEDVAQAVFVIVWTKLPQFEPARPLEHWLYAIAKKECQRTFRNTAKRRFLDFAFRKDIQESAHSSRSPTPGTHVEREVRGSRLTAYLAALRQEDRILLNMRYRRGLSVVEIAEIMGTSEKAVQKRLERARGRLREVMNHDSEA
jgi:RNA polymerase sigma-70 factor (ECF subfamily)